MKEEKKITHKYIENLNNKEKLKQILLNRHLFPEKNMTDLTSMNIDLILSWDLSEFQKQENKFVEHPFHIKSIILQNNPLLSQVYNECLEIIKQQTKTYFKSEFSNTESETPHYYNFHQFQKKQSEYEEYEFKKEKVCSLFTLYLNTVIFVLETECQFKTKFYIIEGILFLLIECQKYRLFNQAVALKLKKQILQSELDPFLHDAMDSDYRPITKHDDLSLPIVNKLNITKSFIKPIEQQKDSTQKQKKELINQINQIKIQFYRELQQKFIQQNKLRTHKQKHQYYMAKYRNFQRNFKRKMGELESKSIYILEAKPLKPKILNKYKDFCKEYYDTIQKQIVTKDIMKEADLEYLQQLLDKKFNPKSKMIYRKILEKKKNHEIKKFMLDKHGFFIFEQPTASSQFIYPQKKMKFKDKVRALLFYKPNIALKVDKFSLFFQMERTKCSYSILIKNISYTKLKMKVFTLHSDFQQFGVQIETYQGSQFESQKIQNSEHQKDNQVIPKLESEKIVINKQNIQNSEAKKKNIIRIGGLDGKFLAKAWNIFKPWDCDIKAIKDYYGQKYAYNALLQNHIISSLILISPFAFVFGGLQIYYQPPNFQDVFWLYFSSQIIMFIWFLIFFKTWDIKEFNFLKSYDQQILIKTIDDNHNSAFQRNLITDDPNHIQDDASFATQMKQKLSYCILIFIFAVKLGFFIGMRILITKLIPQLQEDPNFFQKMNFTVKQLIPYLIYHVTNKLLYSVVYKKLIDLLTDFQSQPDYYSKMKSIYTKNKLHSCGIELIPIIEIMFYENLSESNSCYNSNCLQAFNSYVTCRIWIFLGTTIIERGKEVIVFMIRKKKIKQNNFNIENQQEKAILKKIYENYQKQQHFQSNTQDFLILLIISYAVVIEPASLLFMLADILFRYYSFRNQSMNFYKRPINRMPIIPTGYIFLSSFYVYMIVASYQLFVLFQLFQYIAVTQLNIYNNILTSYSNTVVANFNIICFLGYFLIQLTIKYIVDYTFTGSNQLYKRRERVLQNYKLKTFTNTSSINKTTERLPLFRIGRTY